VPTAKRERKKEGRRQRLAQLEAARRRAARRRQAVVMVLVLAVVVVVVVLVSRGSKHTSSAAGCPNPNGSSARRISFPGPPPNCIDSSKHYTATVQTDVGTFTIALDAKQAPTTVNDFVYLARYHTYDGVIFHRVIPGFVVQGGDPTGTGTGTVGYTVKGEVPKAGSYRVGSVAMAKTATEPAGTAGSQFFVVTGPQGVQLPPQYSLFGQVASGMGVVSKIESDGSPSGTPKVTHRMIKVTISES
jgi:cyclophilin family peptidyl-prolyl cis-trans isomerase